MTVKTMAIALAATVGVAGAASARDQIQIVGSSTVFPFATRVAEEFGKTTDFPTPVIESTGSGGGLKLFCEGTGTGTPDITNASRRIKASEIELCAENGVDRVVEFKVGFDGIVLANSTEHEAYDLTKGQIFLALAREVPVDGAWVENPNMTWADIDPNLPAEKIEVLGPPPTSGTRDAFVELVMEAGVEEVCEMHDCGDADLGDMAGQMREDGVFVEAGENDNLIVQKLQANPRALGIFGFSFLDQNRDKIQGSTIEGVEATFDNIASGEYGVSRSLFFYVKHAHVGVIPGLAEFVTEFMSDKATGAEGYTTDIGLIPLPAAMRDEVQAKLETMPGITVDDLKM